MQHSSVREHSLVAVPRTFSQDPFTERGVSELGRSVPCDFQQNSAVCVQQTHRAHHSKATHGDEAPQDLDVVRQTSPS